MCLWFSAYGVPYGYAGTLFAQYEDAFLLLRGHEQIGGLNVIFSVDGSRANFRFHRQ
jgi:hypothetical protein